MASDRSRDDLVDFLDYLGDKGLLAKATAAARKTAAAKILAVLSEEEASDVTDLDIDLLMSRFDNLNPRQYTPESLQTYRSRLNKGLEDFRAYLDNPVTFRPRSTSRPNRDSVSPKKKRQTASSLVTRPVSAPSSPVVELPNANVLPIPLRQNLTVRIFGLPFDLTKAEATKVANIILAHAMPADD